MIGGRYAALHRSAWRCDMGRGLSPLQLTILARAARKPIIQTSLLDLFPARDAAARSSLSRAVRRLRERGLVSTAGGLLGLTREGLSVSAALTDSPAPAPPSGHQTLADRWQRWLTRHRVLDPGCVVACYRVGSQ